MKVTYVKPDRLPDNASGLRSNAAYSIRLANTEVTWDSGYNVLYTF